MHALLSERFGKIERPNEAKPTACSPGSFSMGFPLTSNAFWVLGMELTALGPLEFCFICNGSTNCCCVEVA